MQHFQILNVGDIREPGDQVKNRALKLPNAWGASNDQLQFNSWSPVRLLGHAILPSDLVNATFRRPL